LFHPLSPAFGKTLPPKLVNDGVSFYADLVHSIAGARAKAQVDFPQLVNRFVVREHKVRERSPVAAYAAKVRDKFRCRVCDFNFADTYGSLVNDRP
jgi:hypothetical protein